MKTSLPQKMLTLVLAVPFVLSSAVLLSQTYNERAELIQNSTHTAFLSDDGTYYTHNNTDNNTFHYWWNSNGLATLVDGYLRTRDTKYTNRMASLVQGIKTNNFWTNGQNYLNTYYDDMEWLALACINAYKLTGDVTYLNVANEVWTDTKGGYSNGAMSWNKDCAPGCKNAIANSPAIIIACRMYNIQGTASDLQLAKDLHTWAKANIIREDGAVYDSPTQLSDGWLFSYNAGMWIGACLELYKATKEQGYIDDAQLSIDYVLRNRLYDGGAFYLNESGGGDGGLFAGIFARYYAEFIRESNISDAWKRYYTNVMNYTADFVWERVNKNNYLVDQNWRNTAGTTVDYAAQLSGLKLFEAAASLQKVYIFRDLDYKGNFAVFGPGEYTTANIQARGALDNDLTSMTVPPGYRVTLYDGDNFTGDSRVVTSNVNWIGGDWNDRVSSIRIEAIGFKTFGTLYRDCGYEGLPSMLSREGRYTLNELEAIGMLDNSSSSMQAVPGFEVTVYKDNNFLGEALGVPVDKWCLVDDGFNDQITSLEVNPKGESGMNGTYYVKNRESGMYLNATGTTNSSNLEQSNDDKVQSQQFTLEEISNGVYKVFSAAGKSIDIANGSIANGTNAALYDYTDGPHQQFILVNTGDGYYQFVIRHSGKVIEVTNASLDNGANVQQFANSGQTSSDWELIPVVTATSKVGTQKGVSVYPTLAKSSLYITSDFDLSDATIEVFDIVGNQEILQAPNGKVIDVSDLASGVYTIRIVKEGKEYYQKFIKK